MPPGKKSEKGSTVAGNGKGATRFGPTRPATTDAVRERARRGTLESKKKTSTEALPGQETGRKGTEIARAEGTHHSRSDELGKVPRNGKVLRS